jgi:hypothetical protein
MGVIINSEPLWRELFEEKANPGKKECTISMDALND